jgi:15-cis-phytoene synthase
VISARQTLVRALSGMGMTELDTAGITDRGLRADYRLCRALAQAHGRTYFLATRLLSPDRRPAVHALYGFARAADDLVDDVTKTTAQRSAALAALAADLRSAHPTKPVNRAVRDAGHRYGIDPGLHEEFLASMQMDLTVTEYQTFGDLRRYMRGSAEVIGLQMLPVLGTVGPTEAAAEYAAMLGVAF